MPKVSRDGGFGRRPLEARRAGRASARLVIVRVVGVALMLVAVTAACSGDSGEPGSASGSTSRPGEVSDSTADERSARADCPELDGSELAVGDHVLTVLPDGFAPDGEAVESSTGHVDMGGESHAVLRAVDGAGRWIELDSFGAESPTGYIAELAEGASASEDVTYERCVGLTSGVERVEYSVAVIHQRDRTIVGAQEWEYGGFTVSGHPDIPAGDLVAVASGLRERPER